VYLKRMVASFFQALVEMRHEEKIMLSPRVYFRVAKDGLALVSLHMDNAQARTLSIAEARQIFRSIKQACGLNGVEEIKIAELSWKTDARAKSNQSTVVVRLNGPSGFIHERLKRDDAIAAVMEFDRKFDLKDSA